jgi:hypothetical protein
VKPQNESRKAFILICALVCLSVSTAIVLTTVHQSIQFRRHARKDRQVHQTQWLLDAGIRKAISELTADENYGGESWRPTSALNGYSHVLVEIEVKPSEADESVRTVRVIAQLGKTASGPVAGALPNAPSDGGLVKPEWFDRTQCSYQFTYSAQSNKTPAGQND